MTIWCIGLESGTTWKLLEGRDHISVPSVSDCLTQRWLGELTWVLILASLCFSLLVLSSKGATCPSLNYVWLCFVSVKMEVRLPRPSYLIVSLLNLFIPQGFQVPINYSAVDSHLQYNNFYTLVKFFFNGKCFKSRSCIVSLWFSCK